MPARRPDASVLTLAAAAAAAAILIVWLGRDTTFTWDELAWIMEYPGISLGDALEPHNGHLVATSRVVYAGLIEVFGPGYVPFRLLSLFAVLLLAATFYVYARPRVGRWLALAPALVLLVFGTAASHVLQGNGFTVVLPLACGLGALIFLRRETRSGDIIATLLLVAAVATYTVGLAFVVGVAVMLALASPRRLWVPAVPAVLYAVWWVWSLSTGPDSADQMTISNLLVLPAWGFQALQNVGSALTGLDYHFAGSGPDGVDAAGAAVAVVVIVALVYRLVVRPARSPALWGGIAIFLALAAMQVLVETILRSPGAPRYAFPMTVAVLIVIVEAAAGLRPPRWAVPVAFGVALIACAANIALLRDGSSQFRLIDAPTARSELGALELAGGQADPGFDPRSADPLSHLIQPWESYGLEREPTAAYGRMVAEYGTIGYDEGELRAQEEGLRERADKVLVAALGIRLGPPPGAAPGDNPSLCDGMSPDDLIADGGEAAVPAGSVVHLATAGTATVGLRRFASSASVPVGFISSGRPGVLLLPDDDAAGDWRMTVTGGAARWCEL